MTEREFGVALIVAIVLVAIAVTVLFLIPAPAQANHLEWIDKLSNEKIGPGYCCKDANCKRVGAIMVKPSEPMSSVLVSNEKQKRDDFEDLLIPSYRIFVAPPEADGSYYCWQPNTGCDSGKISSECTRCLFLKPTQF